MIRHVVLLDLVAGHDPAELADIRAGLDGLRDSIEGFTRFEHGLNRDFEGMSPRVRYGFICDFADEQVSHAYLRHAGHIALGARLVVLCKGGVAGITVVDLELAG